MLRPSVLLSAVAVAAASLFSTMAFAQHEHNDGGGMIVPVHDLRPDGLAVVGDVSHFGFVLVDANGAPQRHHDAEATLTENGVVLFHTANAHEYDGTFSLDYVFAEPGQYVFSVASKLDGKDVSSEFTGTVVAPRAANVADAKLDVKGPTAVMAGQLATYEYQVSSANGSLIPHTDSLFEVRRLVDDSLVFRSHVHSHETAQKVQYAFELPGDYDVRIVGFTSYPTNKSMDFAPVAVVKKVSVSPPAGALADALPDLPGGTVVGVASAQAAPSSDDDPHAGMDMPANLTLYTITDPADEVGPSTQERVVAFAWDGAHMRTQQHVDFVAKIVAPDGSVRFASATLHEYDGVLEIVTENTLPGQYKVAIDASYDSWKAHKDLVFTVLPPVLPLYAGVYQVQVQGLDGLKAGETKTLSISLSPPQADGTPVGLDHGEVELELFPAQSAVPVLIVKLHGHTAVMKADVTFPEAGDYVLHVNPENLEAAPTVIFGPGGPGQPITFPVKVATGLPFPGAPASLASTSAPAKKPLAVPGVEIVGLTFAAALAAFAFRRRT